MQQIVLLVFVLASCVFYTACKKDNPTAPQGYTNPFAGGKGGNHNVVVFTGRNGGTLHARVYLKYGDKKMPTDSTLYDEVTNTMVEPGFGPHAHFTYLKEGTYYIYSQAGAYTADTVVYIDTASAESINVIMNLK